MKVSKGRFLTAFLYKLRKPGREEAAWEYCWWAQWSCFRAEDAIPRDVPKGHLVVYVGEKHKRFVIRVAFLDHPLFKALLERAREEYNFSSHDSRLCIPCDESIFLNIVRCVSTQQDGGIWLPF
ncbi:auxin-induced protein 15A-like [Aristolochia californica]|uniref:auxin-induced protein 15A-like n=1 Tax=Aristolochia californica TaxID=171875 RepID=UPI0035DBA6F6